MGDGAALALLYQNLGHTPAHGLAIQIGPGVSLHQPPLLLDAVCALLLLAAVAVSPPLGPSAVAHRPSHADGLAHACRATGLARHDMT